MFAEYSGDILKRPLPFLLFMVLALRCVGQTPTPAIIAASMDSVKHHSKLDDIHTAAEIEALLTSIHRDYDDFRVNASLVFKERKWDTTDNECQRVADSLHVQA